MQRSSAIFCLIFGMALTGAAMASTLPGAGQEDAAAKFAPILGEYEFDLSDQGMGVIVINIYMEDDLIYAWPESSDEPAEMIPVEGEMFSFRISDPDEGDYDISFIKDDSGQYTKCRVANESMGMDVTGERIQK